MEFREALKTCLTAKYCRFRGRASRSEFWWFSLFSALLNAAVGILASLAPGVGSVISAVLGLWLLLPSLAVTARRLHDRGFSGWWQALPAVLMLAGLACAAAGAPQALPWTAAGAGLVSLGLLVLCVLRGTPGPNRFGPSPPAAQECAAQRGDPPARAA